MSLIELNIAQAGDDESSKQIKTTFHNLVNGIVDSATAAQEIDKIIVNDCREAYISYTSVPKPTAEQIETRSIRTPDPAGWLQLLWNSFGKAAMVIPYNHVGQDRLVSLLQELQRIPLHKVPWFVSDKVIEKELYDLTHANGYDYFQQWLWELDQGHFIGHQTVETDPEAAVAYLNFSAFLGRLLAGGITAGLSLSALIRRPESPFCMQKIAWTAKSADSAEQAKRYQPYASAAAQWILYAGDALYELCDKDISGLGVKWSRTLWDSWKAKFNEVAEDKRFSDATRDLVRQAIECMVQLEQGNGATGIVQKFGLTSWREDENEDKEEE
ncbi:hypothetical protein B0O99DRAFT_621656 [Bisporella sp. PMI_857]|nr:hypothetical protein B0O99DRAFT_621656 [Bisporella sp. PMI_857]